MHVIGTICICTDGGLAENGVQVEKSPYTENIYVKYVLKLPQSVTSKSDTI